MKLYYYCYLILLFPFILMAKTAKSISGSELLPYNHPLNFNSNDSSKGINLGDAVPDVKINHIYNYTSTTAKISDFKGKLLILDFWATWCSPCVAMIPKMDALQKEFKGKVQFLPVNNQDEKVVVPFLKKLKRLKSFDLPDVLLDSTLNALFPHTYLPHFVWINAEGRVAAITSYDEVNSKNIQIAVSGAPVNLKPKYDKPLDGDVNKLFGGDTAIATTITHKLIAGYQENLPSQWVISPDDSTGKSIQATNLIMADLFNIALGEGKAFYGRNRIIYDVKDTAALTLEVNGDEAIEWMRAGHVYSYEVKTPRGMNQLAYQIMTQDLRNYFKKYEVNIENRPVKCLALIRIGSSDHLRSKGGKSKAEFDGISGHLTNFPLSRLSLQLNTIYMYRSAYPVVDMTGYKSWVDLDINARMSDPVAVNRELEKYGLKLELKVLPLDMMVIRDHQSQVN